MKKIYLSIIVLFLFLSLVFAGEEYQTTKDIFQDEEITKNKKTTAFDELRAEIRKEEGYE